MPAFKLTLAEVPNPTHMPIAKIYRPGLTVAVIQPLANMEHVIRNIRAAIDYNDWLQWLQALNDPEINPVLAWEDPEKHIPEYYWKLKAIPENIVPSLRL